MTAEIIDLGPMLADVRFTCRFVRTVDDPEERERIREAMRR